MAENIREIISSAVSEALNRSSNQQHSSRLGSQSQSGEEQTSSSSGSRQKRPQILPSSFLKKKKPKAVAIQVWDKDILCLPRDYVSNPQDIPIPRGKSRLFLNKQGLTGKVRLTSDMEEEEVRGVMCSVFSERMGNRTNFQFKVFWDACRKLIHKIHFQNIRLSLRSCSLLEDLRH